MVNWRNSEGIFKGGKKFDSILRLVLAIGNHRRYRIINVPSAERTRFLMSQGAHQSAAAAFNWAEARSIFIY